MPLLPENGNSRVAMLRDWTSSPVTRYERIDSSVALAKIGYVLSQFFQAVAFVEFIRCRLGKYS